MLPQIDERRQQVAAYFIPTFFWRKEWDSLRDIISLHLLLLDSSYTSLILIISLSLSRQGCKQPFHRLFGRLVLLGNPGIVLRADSQPVRIPQLTKKNSETRYVSPNFLAERVGFEPTMRCRIPDFESGPL